MEVLGISFLSIWWGSTKFHFYFYGGSELVGWVLWHINLCRLFNAKVGSGDFIFIYMGMGGSPKFRFYLYGSPWDFIFIHMAVQDWLVGFYGISTFVGYLTPRWRFRRFHFNYMKGSRDFIWESTRFYFYLYGSSRNKPWNKKGLRLQKVWKPLEYKIY